MRNERSATNVMQGFFVTEDNKDKKGCNVRKMLAFNPSSTSAVMGHSKAFHGDRREVRRAARKTGEVAEESAGKFSCFYCVIESDLSVAIPIAVMRHMCTVLLQLGLYSSKFRKWGEEGEGSKSRRGRNHARTGNISDATRYEAI